MESFQSGFQSEFRAEFQMLSVRWLGELNFDTALKIQNEAVSEVKNGAPGIILACEHPTTITLGKRAQALNDVLASLDLLREKKIEIIGTERGGHATLHNPGQLVLYPILPLRRWNLGVRTYVECLERASAYFFAEFGVEVTRGYEPGLWVNGKKIAAFGIRIDRGVSLHGAALNISNDLEAFSLIKQCGASVLPTSLRCEMAEFMTEDAMPRFNFSELSSLWLSLFKTELLALKGPFLELDVPPLSPVESEITR